MIDEDDDEDGQKWLPVAGDSKGSMVDGSMAGVLPK